MSPSDCIFCRIASGEVPAETVHRDDDVVAFKDLNPRAPLHVLVIPRRHVAKLGELDDEALGGRLLQAARRVAREAGYEDYRVVVNNGAGAGQSVGHLHLHVLGGRQFSWPPG